MLRRWHVWVLLLLGICLLLPLAAHAYLGTFSRPMADTYCHGGVARVRGLARAQLAWYRQWTGRFSFTFAENVAGLLGPRATPWLPAVALGAWFLALVGALLPLARLSGLRTRLLVSAVVSVLILHVTLDGLPLVAQSLYWSDGMHNYVLPLILFTAYAGLVGWRQERLWEANGSTVALAMSGVLTFAASGASEMFGAAQIALLLTAIAALLLVGSPKLRLGVLPLLLAGVLGALLAMAVVVAAPGNRVRQSLLSPSPGPLRLIQLALDYARQFVLNAVARSSLNLVAALALPAWLGARCTASHPSLRLSPRDTVRLILWLPLATFALLVCCFAAAAYGLSAPPPPRSLVIPQYLLLSALVAWAWLLGHAAREVGLGRLLGREVLVWKAVFGCLVFLLALNALLSARRTLATRGTFAAYAGAWDGVERLIHAAKAEGVRRVSIPALPNPAGLEEIGPDPDHWVNRCASSYYGVSVVAHEVLPPPSGAELARMTPLDARLGDAAAVLGYAIDRPSVGAGETLTVTVYWRPREATDRPFTVFVHLAEPNSAPIAQYDGYPRQGSYPTTTWVYDHPFADNYPLVLPPRLPAVSRVDLVLGLYDLQTMERLPASGADADPGRRCVRLGEIAVRR